VRQQGAAHVWGLDVAEPMLARASATTPDPAITYSRADREHLEPALEAFNIVSSSLALHSRADLNELLSAVYRALVPEGSLVCSVEHRMCTAPVAPPWCLNAAGRKRRPLDGS
jgi:ubiquinone/menaquinone biosynthesis C-methylase UbiE